MSNENLSLREIFLQLPLAERKKRLSRLSDEQIEALAFDWSFYGRPKQFAPKGDWGVWLLLAGRGFGKTRCGAEWIRDRVISGKARRIALIAPTAADARDTMLLGESGLLNVFPPHQRPVYNPSKRSVTFHNGAKALLFSAEDPESLRGPQFDTAWTDELAAWKRPETWEMLQFCLRLGDDPRVVVTTTPKPNELIRGIIKDKRTVITRGSTLENSSNLASDFMQAIYDKYDGTRLGRQELYAEVLDDNPNALWSASVIEKNRIKREDLPQLDRIVVAVDPAVTNNEKSDETGIIVAGIAGQGKAKHAYILEDLTMKGKPQEWALAVVEAYKRWDANRVIVETNQGGDLIATTLRGISEHLPIQEVRASKGKFSRAEPISALYDQDKVSHVGSFDILEDQMCNYNPAISDRSPDRMDALVWALTATMIDTGSTGLFDYYRQRSEAEDRRRIAEKLNGQAQSLTERFLSKAEPTKHITRKGL